MRRIAIVGATGAVGHELLAVLEERCYPVGQMRLFASPRSAGQVLRWRGEALRVETLSAAGLRDADLVFFSATATVSREFAPAAARANAVVIDNSSAFRMDADVPLVIPEVNGPSARLHRGLIANPNCSTIILAVALWPLHRTKRALRVIVSTYQAASGAGARAMDELRSQTAAVLAGHSAVPRVFREPCAFNVFSHNTPLDDLGVNLEERKMMRELAKIFADESLRVAATCMRVPVLRSHLEAAAVEFEQPIAADEARRILGDSPGVRVVDDPAANKFPTSLDATGQDDVLVGRIRADASVAGGRGLQFICAGDQLRKGAALNAVQVAELLN